MLTGRPPFTGPSAQAIFAQVLSEEPRPLVLERKTVPHHIDAAVARALEKLPADRWQTVAQFAEALTGAVASSGTRSRRLSAAPAPSAIPWAISAELLLADAWVRLRAERTARPEAGPIRVDVELEPGEHPPL